MSFNVNVIIAAFRGIGSVMVKMTVMMDPMRGTVVSWSAYNQANYIHCELSRDVGYMRMRSHILPELAYRIFFRNIVLRLLNILAANDNRY